MSFSIRFSVALSSSSFPCLLLRVELCQLSGINRTRKKSLRYVYLQQDVLLVLSPLCANSWQFFFCHSCLSLFIFFFTSFTINASESHVGCFRYHTESSEFSKVRVTNTQCRKTNKQNIIPSVPSFAHTVRKMDCIFQLWIKYFILTTSSQPGSKCRLWTLYLYVLQFPFISHHFTSLL